MGFVGSDKWGIIGFLFKGSFKGLGFRGSWVVISGVS